MRKQQELVIQKVTPGASIAVAQLHEINGAVKFGPPAKRLHFPHARIDLHEGTRTQQRVKRVILQADIAVLTVPDVQVLDQRDRYFSPKFHHAREKVGVVQLEGPVKSNGERNRAVRVVDLQRSQVCVWQWGGKLVESQLLQVKPVEAQQVGELHPVNGAQTVQLENARDGI